MAKLKICCISDTHSLHNSATLIKKMPEADECDVLVHTGDYSGRGSVKEAWEFLQWLDKMQKERFPYVVFIAGNHDFINEQSPEEFKRLLGLLKNPNIFYLNEESVEIEGFKFWGSPWTPWFYDWAFNAKRGEEIKKHWDKIPQDTDVLLTHGPPKGLLDQVKMRASPNYGDHVGCEELLKAIDRIKPKLSAFGHIHEAYGKAKHNSTQVVNGSTCNVKYRPVNPPIIVEIEK